MIYNVREMKEDEYHLMDEFIYKAIFVPEGEEAPPKSIINLPEIQIYVKDFGSSVHDKALVADAEGKIVGCAWVRIMNDYGHIDDETPSLSISVMEEYRGKGVGRKLLKEMIELERKEGYSRISLSVQKANYAVKLYESMGFKVVEDKDDEYIMAVDLR